MCSWTACDCVAYEKAMRSWTACETCCSVGYEAMGSCCSVAYEAMGSWATRDAFYSVAYEKAMRSWTARETCCSVGYEAMGSWTAGFDFGICQDLLLQLAPQPWS